MSIFLWVSTPNDIETLSGLVAPIAGILLDDGVRFRGESVIAERIAEGGIAVSDKEQSYYFFSG